MLKTPIEAPILPPSQIMNSAEQQPTYPAEDKLCFSILQCKSCRSILGDTSSVLSFNRENSLITLHKKSDNIVMDEDLVTSKGEFDYGSTFNNLHCKNCNEWLGRTYRTTTPELDNIRGRFSFNLNSLILFEIAEIEQPTQLLTSEQASSRGSGVEQLEITKLQKFSLALYDRLEQLEAENDILKSEILTISSKIEGYERFNGNISGSAPKPIKTRKTKDRKEDEGAQETQRPFKIIPSEPLKEIAASISTADYDLKPLNEKHRIVSAIDEDSALETISWAILNTGRLPQIQQEIDF